jgi:hypothetical protein
MLGAHGFASFLGRSAHEFLIPDCGVQGNHSPAGVFLPGQRPSRFWFCFSTPLRGHNTDHKKLPSHRSSKNRRSSQGRRGERGLAPCRRANAKIRDQGSGIRDQGSGIRDQGSGIRDQGSGIRNSWALRAGEGRKTMRPQHLRGGKAAGNFF